VYSFGGVDASGQKWTRQLTVSFLPEQISAAITLSSSPATVVRNAKGDPNCDADHPFYQQLNLQETNGFEVRLTKFLAGGNDFSDQILNWFGALRLAPLGALRAGICWNLDSEPDTLSYEVDGVDSAGRSVTAHLKVEFRGPVQNPGTLSSSKSS